MAVVPVTVFFHPVNVFPAAGFSVQRRSFVLLAVVPLSAFPIQLCYSSVLLSAAIVGRGGGAERGGGGGVGRKREEVYASTGASGMLGTRYLVYNIPAI